MMLAKCRNEEHASFQMIIATRKSNERFSSDSSNGNIYIMRKTTEYRKRIREINDACET